MMVRVTTKTMSNYTTITVTFGPNLNPEASAKKRKKKKQRLTTKLSASGVTLEKLSTEPKSKKFKL